jgi:hypothetical protein
VEALHSVLGYVTGVAVIAGMAWSVALATWSRAPATKVWFDRFALVVLAIVIAEVVTGAVWQASGGEPAAEHALLAGISVAAIPLLRTLGASMGGFGRLEPWLWLITYAIVGASLIGLYVTG